MVAGAAPGVQVRRDARLGHRSFLQESNNGDPGTRLLSRLSRLLQCLRTDLRSKQRQRRNAFVLRGRRDGVHPGATNTIDGIAIIKDQAYIGDFETKFKDLAVFGELTAHLTSAWSLTGGTRVFKQTISQAQQTGLLFDGGPLFGPVVPIANTSLSDSWRRALWKINTAYQIDKTNLVYATWSQGFRRGGVNALPASEPGENYVTPTALTKLAPDTADNYEIGAKGTLLNRYRYSAAIYDIQWHNIQEGVDLTPLVLPASLNIGQAYSRGLELEFDALLTQHFEANLDYTYDQTKLTSINPLFVYPNVSAPPPALGSPLPGTPKSSVAVNLEYGHVPIAGGQLRYAIGAHYQSSVIPALSATVPTVAGYTLVDTRLSFARSHWITYALCQQSNQQSRHHVLSGSGHLRQSLSSGGVAAAHLRDHGGLFVQRMVRSIE